MLGVSFLLLGVALELLAVSAGRLRRIFAVFAVIATVLGAALFLLAYTNAFSASLLIICLYRLFNVLRLVRGRMHESYLRHVVQRTSMVLVGLQVLIAVIWLMWDRALVGHGRAVWLGVAIGQLMIAGLLLYSTWRSIRKTTPPADVPGMSDSELPTVSVCIPARNETEDLQACLLSLLAGNYPKLEILVLDDCSQMPKTPEIIRSFAHDGVRFIAGSEPPAGWLAKNWAYHCLAQEASGEVLLFCGVDVRFAPDSLRQVVATMASKHKQMLSLVPVRTKKTRWPIMQAMRYWWEFAPPRRLFNRPPVLSSCWLISSSLLEKTGGFAGTTRMIVPEAAFAKAAISTDNYSFMRSNALLGVSSIKDIQEQRATTVRTRYPQLNRRPELVLIVSLAELLLLVMPFMMAVLGWLLPLHPSIPLVALMAAVCLTAGHALIVFKTMPSATLGSFVNFWLVILVDIGLAHYSMYKYEFSEVVWKGRNVCLPVMYSQRDRS